MTDLSGVVAGMPTPTKRRRISHPAGDLRSDLRIRVISPQFIRHPRAHGPFSFGHSSILIDRLLPSSWMETVIAVTEILNISSSVHAAGHLSTFSGPRATSLHQSSECPVVSLGRCRCSSDSYARFKDTLPVLGPTTTGIEQISPAVYL